MIQVHILTGLLLIFTLKALKMLFLYLLTNRTSTVILHQSILIQLKFSTKEPFLCSLAHPPFKKDSLFLKVFITWLFEVISSIKIPLPHLSTLLILANIFLLYILLI
jgi:hypothetical protein